MATIRKRGEYSWEAQIRRKGHATLTKTFTYRQDAEAWARMTESEIERGVFISRTTAENTTLKEALDRYRTDISSKKRGGDKESYIITRFIDMKLSARSMASIRSGDISSWRDTRLKDVGPATVRRELAVLSHVFTIAKLEWGMESLQNPVETTSKPKLPSGRDRRVSTSEIDAICTASGSVELPAIIRLAVETGMRRGEIVGLQWKKIDFSSRTIHLNLTKNGESRDVPLSSAAVATLQTLKEAAQTMGANVVVPHDLGRVFNCRPDSVTQAFNRAVERARQAYEKRKIEEGTAKVILSNDPFLREVSFHDLRHEATSRFFEKGLNVMEASSITGHKDLRMLKRYTHLKAEDLARKLG